MGAKLYDFCRQNTFGGEKDNKQPETIIERKDRQDNVPQQPLKLIYFEDAIDDHQNDQTKELSDFQVVKNKVEETPTRGHNNPMKSTVSKQSHIRQQDLTVIIRQQELEQRYKITQHCVDVPFSVVKMIISKDLSRVLHETADGKQFYKKYEEGFAKKQNINDWKLNKNNFYLNCICQKQKKYALINQDYFFQGFLIEQDGKIIPTQQGVLIDKNGSYNGDFEMGKSNGNGKYFCFHDNMLFDGKWDNGVFMEGTIKCDFFEFAGRFKNSYAEGPGALSFKNNVKYIGHFKEGLYSGEHNKLFTPDYLYEGAFQKGKKQGRGRLNEYEKALKGKKLKYKPSQQYDGKWEQDKFNCKTKGQTVQKYMEKMK